MKTISIFSIAAALTVLCSCGARQTSSESDYMPEIEIGAQAAQVSVPGTDGQEISLGDYLGKYVVLDFWASWCPDCRAEFDAVKSLYAKYSQKGVSFIGISFDFEEEAWRACLDEQQFGWPQACNFIKKKENPVSDAFGVRWIPALILVDPEGNYAACAITAADMDEILEKELEK